MSPSRYVLLLLALLAVWQCVHYFPMLPDPVPTHFSAEGQPNGWTPKTQYLLINLAYVLGMPRCSCGSLDPIRRVPNDWINLPHKDYWLAPEHRDATMDALQRQMEWLGAATVALFIGITQLNIAAALSGQPLDAAKFWLLFGPFMLYAVVWTIRFAVWLARKPKSDDRIGA